MNQSLKSENHSQSQTSSVLSQSLDSFVSTLSLVAVSTLTRSQLVDCQLTTCWPLHKPPSVSYLLAAVQPPSFSYFPFILVLHFPYILNVVG